MTWIRVLLPYACFGIAVQGGRVVDAAPIAAWTIGKPERQVADFYRRKGGTFTRLTPIADAFVEEHYVPGMVVNEIGEPADPKN